jgi:hypothetical protein
MLAGETNSGFRGFHFHLANDRVNPRVDDLVEHESDLPFGVSSNACDVDQLIAKEFLALAWRAFLRWSKRHDSSGLFDPSQA